MNKKLVFITGASSGIGEACARKFAANGYRLILNARSVDKLETLKVELQTQYGSDIMLLPFDVRDRLEAEKMISNLPADFKDIDILVNNAGLALGLEKEQEGDVDQWYTMIDTNVKALLLITRLVVPGMVARGCGHVINIGSVAGDAAYPGGAVYCATKAAVKTITDGLRMDLFDTPVRVTNVKPGLVETNFSNVRFSGDTERAKKVYQGIQPLTGADIADVVFFAASAPSHVQIAEVLVLATHQASGSHIWRKS
jgi:NADP-dependent 3-hydroxy acid dehydrogenase YdfG